VVIDPTINPAKMEMFADQQARGGILEPPGICEVKFRPSEQVAAMHRLDAQLIDMDGDILQFVCLDCSDRRLLSQRSRRRSLCR
jgi:acetyl-CoA carboxylase carboxyltransferase component